MLVHHPPAHRAPLKLGKGYRPCEKSLTVARSVIFPDRANVNCPNWVTWISKRVDSASSKHSTGLFKKMNEKKRRKRNFDVVQG
jgi:hypothetical protein